MLSMPLPPIFQQHQNLSLHTQKDRKPLERGVTKKPTIIPPQSLNQTQKLQKEETLNREKFSSSWPCSSVTLTHLGRRPQPRCPQLLSYRNIPGSTDNTPRGCRIPRPVAQSCESMPASDSVDSGVKSCKNSSQSSLARDEMSAQDQLERFSLSLTPEAILVLQKRNLEKQLLARQKSHDCTPSTSISSLQCKKLYQTRTKGLSALNAGLQTPTDIRAILKISLLNDQHKYDDVEYEEEDDEGYVDECLIRKCTEWLRGVESAATLAGDHRELDTLPHLKGL